MKLVIIGQAPSEHGRGKPLAGRCGSLLAVLSGLSLDEFLERTDRRNLFEVWQGKAGKGDHFSLHDARPIARAMVGELFDRDVVLLGNGVTAAFGFRCPVFTWAVNGESGASWAWCPHPSGINRWWNDRKNYDRASAFWRSALSTRTVVTR